MSWYDKYPRLVEMTKGYSTGYIEGQKPPYWTRYGRCPLCNKRHSLLVVCVAMKPESDKTVIGPTKWYTKEEE